MIESELKSVFIGNSVFQKQVQNILLKDDFYIVPEVQFINGITADFCVFDKNNQINSIIECKGDDLGCIDFLPNKQKKEIIINYNPIYSKENTIKYIRNNVKILYLENYLKGEISI